MSCLVVKGRRRRSSGLLTSSGPTPAFSILARIEGCAPHFQIRVGNEEGKEAVELRVEISPAVFFDEMRRLQALRQTIAGEVLRELGLTVTVKLVEPRSLQGGAGKSPRVIDSRKGGGDGFG